MLWVGDDSLPDQNVMFKVMLISTEHLGGNMSGD